MENPKWNERFKEYLDKQAIAEDAYISALAASQKAQEELERKRHTLNLANDAIRAAVKIYCQIESE